MSTMTSIDKAKLYLRDKLESKQKPRPLPAVTISRMTGGGGTSIAHELADYLQKLMPGGDGAWTYFDKNLIDKVLEDHNLPQRLVKHFPEDKIYGYESVFGEMLGVHPSTWKLVHQTSETIHQLARMGQVVIVGRGGNFITAELNHVAHVRLVGSVSKRAERIAKRDLIPKDEAVSFCEKNDKAREKYIRQVFSKDINDPLNYHLVINTDRLADEMVVKLIADFVHRNFN